MLGPQGMFGPQGPDLSDDSRHVLREIRDQAMDGYSVMRRTGLDEGKLEAALKELTTRSLVRIEGQPHGKFIGKTYLWIPPDAQGIADLILGNMSRLR